MSPRTMVLVKASDNRSGVGSVEYAIGNSSYKLHDIPFSAGSQSGRHTIKVRATDKVGNRSEPVGVTITVDAAAPSTRHSFRGANKTVNYTACINPQTQILLAAADSMSGVKAIEYSYGTSPMKPYTGAFGIKEEGAYIVKYRAIDNVGNVEEIQMLSVMVDNSPPRITETFSALQVADAPDMGPARYKAPAMMFIPAQDNTAGLERTWYTVNQKAQAEYKGPVRFDTPGKYVVKITARDNVGLLSEKTVSFVVD